MTWELGLRTFGVGAIRAELRELRMWDDLEGMLEGTPHLHRRFRIGQLEKQLAGAAALYVHDLDGMRADAAARAGTWLPRAQVYARLTASWCPDEAAGPGGSELSVLWFQQPGEDPFGRLADIVRPLDWTALARFEPACD
ncbi:MULTISPECIES: hypothetical protein [unclassified Kitasatospora]|uniref:hypothetical protein n=1 Tax=unclassified Kitasatospora TaxID=2633591 RepID=UPI000710D5C8|nr:MULTISPECIES: hypothetical protein [unclassified Kitasatospora]KQV15825.1 hypothetical protein ASC99_29435 [Kitasatospora sp. Root107]KRB65077.1 hypothetical protein ASE03_32355 [Kitasatospora sp. Root187]